MHHSRGCHCRNACTTICDRGQNALTHLDRKFLLLHCIKILGFSSDISLDLDQFYRKYQRDIVAWPLAMANISIWPLTFVLTAVTDRSTEAASVTPPCYFPVTSHLFPSYFSNISHFSTISQLFLENFSFPNYFWSISQSFLTSQLLLDYFPVISRLFPGYSSSREKPFLTFRITCLSWFV